MPDLLGYREILQSDIRAYSGVKDVLANYHSGEDSDLPAEQKNIPIDSEIKKIIEENQMSTDPDTLKGNFNRMLDKLSDVFGSMKKYLITLGQNLTLRKETYDDFERVHPTKLIQFHKAPLFYKFLVEIASYGGRVDTAMLIEMYPDRYQKLISLCQDFGFINFERGGQIVRLREDVCREVLFREYATPTTPAETRNREYFRWCISKILEIVDEPQREKQHLMIKVMQDEMFGTDIRDHVTLEWIAPLLNANIKTVDEFINTHPRELCKILSTNIREVSVSVLSLVSFFKRDTKNLNIEIFDYNVFSKLDSETCNKLTKSLLRNNINTWGDLFEAKIVKIEEVYQSRKVNYYRLLAFCRWFTNLTKAEGRFYYKPILDDFVFHENLRKNDLEDITKFANKEPEEYLKIEKSEEADIKKRLAVNREQSSTSENSVSK